MSWMRPNLHTRISLVLTLLTAGFLAVLAGFWLQGTRAGIHEEVEAAARVSEQWITVLAQESAGWPQDADGSRVLARIQQVGRVRAHSLEVLDVNGERLYLSPRPTYKEGQAAPAWFAGLVEPAFTPRRIAVGSLTVVLRPDASRAALDAWDDLSAMAGWAAALLVLLFLAARAALDRALRPLGQVMAALDRTGRGRFDTRLPVYEVPELARLARAFNGMADRLAEAVDENVRLESDREVARRLRSRLEEERQAISRELHDELSQGITAVRALAGAIAQRSETESAVHSASGSIIAVAGEMQDGVRAILARLRPLAGEGDNLEANLRRYLDAWQRRHSDIAVAAELTVAAGEVSDAVAAAALRVVQEGLTNVVRHADARRVELAVACRNGWLEIDVIDDGRGLASGPSAQPGCGLGLTGMGERLEALGGQITIDNHTPAGGCRLTARMPAQAQQLIVEDNP